MGVDRGVDRRGHEVDAERHRHREVVAAEDPADAVSPPLVEAVMTAGIERIGAERNAHRLRQRGVALGRR